MKLSLEELENKNKVASRVNLENCQMNYPLPESNRGTLVNAIILHDLIKYVG